MPKPVKKATKKSNTPKRASADPVRRAGQMMAEHLGKMSQGKFAAKAEPDVTPPHGDPVREYMSKIGKLGGKVSGAKRMEMPEKKRKEIARLGGLAKAKNRPVQS